MAVKHAIEHSLERSEATKHVHIHTHIHTLLNIFVAGENVGGGESAAQFPAGMCMYK